MALGVHRRRGGQLVIRRTKESDDLTKCIIAMLECYDFKLAEVSCHWLAALRGGASEFLVSVDESHFEPATSGLCRDLYFSERVTLNRFLIIGLRLLNRRRSGTSLLSAQRVVPFRET